MQKHLELQNSECHKSFEEQTPRLGLVEKNYDDVSKGIKPDVLASLKLSVKDERRDANQALQSLGKLRTSIEDKFD